MGRIVKTILRPSGKITYRWPRASTPSVSTPELIPDSTNTSRDVAPVVLDELLDELLAALLAELLFVSPMLASISAITAPAVLFGLMGGSSLSWMP